MIDVHTDPNVLAEVVAEPPPYVRVRSGWCRTERPRDRDMRQSRSGATGHVDRAKELLSHFE